MNKTKLIQPAAVNRTMPHSFKPLSRKIQLARTLFVAVALLLAFAGCSTSSTSLPSNSGNSLYLNRNAPALEKPIPTDASKTKVPVFVADTECDALITGRPHLLAERVRQILVEFLSSSGNFVVLQAPQGARYLIEMRIEEFDREVRAQSGDRLADVLLESAAKKEKRLGLFEIRAVVVDPITGNVLHSFNASSITQDIKSSHSTGVLGFTSVGVSYSRKSDDQVIDEAVRQAAVELWSRLVENFDNKPQADLTHNTTK